MKSCYEIPQYEGNVVEEQSFKHYIDQAIIGLRHDPEIQLEEKQKLELCLTDKAEEFLKARCSEEESIQLACESLGSPIDLAVEIENANKKHLIKRGWLRLFFGLIIVPVALVFALYVGYTRFVQLPSRDWITGGTYGMMSGANENHLNKRAYRSPLVDQLQSKQSNAPRILQYWKTNRNEPDNRIYYAYYAIMLKQEDSKYEEAMLIGEQLEPQNALYNILLAHYYLKLGFDYSEHSMGPGYKPILEKRILDRVAFENGIAQLHKAAHKPYLRTHQADIVSKKIASMPQPVLFEDYMRISYIRAAELFPYNSKYFQIARRIPLTADLLMSENRNKEAEALMDTWIPITALLAKESNVSLIHPLVTISFGKNLSNSAVQIYKKLGRPSKSQEAQNLNNRLKRVREELKASALTHFDECDNPVFPAEEPFAGMRASPTVQMLREHGSRVSYVMVFVYKNMILDEQDLKPGRMFEHVQMEEVFLQALMAAFALGMIGTLSQTGIWLIWFRKTRLTPLLLLPTIKQMLTILAVGVILPAIVYWIYTRFLPVGGREYGWVSGMVPRFITEISLITLLMFCIPVCIIQNKIRQRIVQLGIPGPAKRNEAVTTWAIRFVAAIIMLITVHVWHYWGCLYNWIIFCKVGLVLAVIISVAGIWYVKKKRSPYSLYYATLARSMVPVYAILVICISVTLQPMLMKNEAYWLRKDNIFFGFNAKVSPATIGLTSNEQQLSQQYSNRLRKVLGIEDSM